MKKNTHITLSNSSHKVSGELVMAQTAFNLPEGMAVDTLTLPLWALRYFKMEVEGVQSQNTEAAKKRDLQAFMQWYADANGHLAIEQWLPRDTQGFLNHLEHLGRAPTTINRVFATLRRFARWVNEQPDPPFPAGLPTRGVKELSIDEPDALKLDKRDVYQLFKAADNLVLTEVRKNARPRRNRAILALLYYTGLRVSELVDLKRKQYDGKYLLNVRRKGKNRSKKLYTVAECRSHLDEYIETERRRDDSGDTSEWLILPGNGNGSLTRRQVAKILNHLAEEANKHRQDDEIEIHPHRLRHTFGSEIREKTGSDTETAALLGHAGLKYVGRYVRNTQEEREAILESMSIEGPTETTEKEPPQPKKPTKNKTKKQPGKTAKRKSNLTDEERERKIKQEREMMTELQEKWIADDLRSRKYKHKEIAKRNKCTLKEVSRIKKQMKMN